MRYERSERGAHQWLQHSRDLRKVLRRRAEEGVALAKATAPVGPPRDDKRFSKYITSIRVEDGPIVPAYGDWAARMSVWVHATAGHSAWVEIGNNQPGVRARHVLGGILPFISDPPLDLRGG